MAAVLCQSVGALVGQACNALTIPCRAFGMGCEKCGDLITSPFFPYLAVTFGLNVPAVVYGLSAFFSACPNISYWLVINGLLCLFHMMAAWYIVNTIRHDDFTMVTAAEASAAKAATKAGDAETPYQLNMTVPESDARTGAANSFARVKHVLCYDKIMAVYIVSFIIWLVWLGMGFGHKLNNQDDCDEVDHWITVDIILGYCYTCVVGMAFACSLCCLR